MTVFGDLERGDEKLGRSHGAGPMLLGPYGNRIESQVLSLPLLSTEKAIGGHCKGGDNPEGGTVGTSIPDLLEP